MLPREIERRAVRREKKSVICLGVHLIEGDREVAARASLQVFVIVVRKWRVPRLRKLRLRCHHLCLVHHHFWWCKSRRLGKLQVWLAGKLSCKPCMVREWCSMRRHVVHNRGGRHSQ